MMAKMVSAHCQFAAVSLCQCEGVEPAAAAAAAVAADARKEHSERVMKIHHMLLMDVVAVMMITTAATLSADTRPWLGVNEISECQLEWSIALMSSPPSTTNNSSCTGRKQKQRARVHLDKKEPTLFACCTHIDQVIMHYCTVNNLTVRVLLLFIHHQLHTTTTSSPSLTR